MDMPSPTTKYELCLKSVAMCFGFWRPSIAFWCAVSLTGPKNRRLMFKPFHLQSPIAGRIRLAIAVNQVAAIFVKDTPRPRLLSSCFFIIMASSRHHHSIIMASMLSVCHSFLTLARILIVPALQATVGILWILVWALSASFLISQVPDGYTPKATAKFVNFLCSQFV